MFRICKGKAEYYNSMFYEMSSFAIKKERLIAIIHQFIGI